jgi:dipeptidyl aminopeptidase/acylaminoacyl peptidase
MNRRQILAGALLLAPSASALAQPDHDQRMMSFQSGGSPIAVEWFPAAGSRPGETRPAVLLLHGADGLTFETGYRMGAQMVAASGFHVAFVHYLDRTGERRVAYATLRQRFPLWAETVRDGLTWLPGQPGVDPGRLGIVGISLGAALGLHVAAGDGRVKAVVDYFGPVPEGLANRGARLPPTLILHGENDRVVPVSNARTLAGLLEASGTPHEMQIYPGQGHALTGLAQLDAASRTAAFLGRYLAG